MNTIDQRCHHDHEAYRPQPDPVCEQPPADAPKTSCQQVTARQAVDGLLRSRPKASRALEALVKGGDLLKLLAEEGVADGAIEGVMELAKRATEKGLAEATKEAADKVIISSAGRAAANWSSVAALLKGVSVAQLMIEGYRLGFQQITKAHQKAHEHGVRVKTATGLARVLMAATRDPKASIGALRAKVTQLGKQDDSSQRALNTVMRRGRELPQDVRKRRETVAGHQRGMEAGLKIVANLSATQRASLAKVAMQQTGKRDLDEAMREIADGAIGVGRK